VVEVTVTPALPTVSVKLTSKEITSSVSCEVNV